LAETDDGRVEARLGAVRGGFGSSADKIGELEARRLQFERQMRPPPTTRFSDLLRGEKEAEGEPEMSAKEKKLQELPRKGPQISGVPPRVRTRLGRAEADGDVVLKG
jgi:hypothetical protein